MNGNNQWISILNADNEIESIINLNLVIKIGIRKFSDGERAYAIYITTNDKIITESATLLGRSTTRAKNSEYVAGFYSSKEDADTAFEMLTNGPLALRPWTVGQMTPIGVVVTAPTQKDVLEYRERKELVSKVTEGLINQVGGDAK